MWLMAALFVIFLVSGMPLAFAIGIAGLMFFVLSDTIPLSIGVQKIASASQSFPMLAVPFFILAGHMMNQTGITARLIHCSNVMVSWMAGGLAQVSIVLSTLMGGISGSAVADACMEARILGPSMLDRGYSKGYTAAVIALSSLITATIPPSLGLILYGFVGNVSIGRLFLAGVIPGLLMMVFLMATAYWIAKRRGYQGEAIAKPTTRELLGAIAEAKWALLFPVILVGGIRFGVFTPSEAGAFAVVYAFVIGTLVYRELSLRKIVDALHDSMSDIGMVMLIIIFSAMVGYAIIFEQVPQTLAQALGQISDNPTVILFLILIFLFIAGMFVESTVNVLLLTPIFVPIIQSIGFDPVHFGILMMTIVTMGSMTPPVGVAMYAVCGLLKCPTEHYVVESLPFIGAVVVLIIILAWFPQIVLFLPNLLM